MPFIVYFFISLLVLYIPAPTLLLLVNRLAEQHDTVTALTKLFLLLLVGLDYYTSYYWLRRVRVRKIYYLFLIANNLVEFFIHSYLLFRFQMPHLLTIWLFQLLVLLCMFVFPLSKKFREALFY
ncbi:MULTISPECIES: hypothetical protein [unclassified Enterococcus]|uniref:hypothetical protein n=1 Tax=unclassified Enterococcus TaxID=2608891 RepID=UPI0013EBB4BD|nr:MULTISPECIES: hypothetical protein [unclassified Enterococcus]